MKASSSTTTNATNYQLCEGLYISRVITGLWQIADSEKEGDKVDAEKAADILEEYLEAGLTTFDMADHYGSAEEITGVLIKRRRSRPSGGSDLRPVVLTKWCPPLDDPEADFSLDGVRTAIQRSLTRLGVDKIDLLQLHWWRYEDPRYIDVLHHLSTLRDKEGLLGALGLTNFDTPHLRVVLASGIKIVSNQVCMSLLDHRACGPMTSLCQQYGVKLLAYGCLAGGLLTDQAVGQPSPPRPQEWSQMKYARFVQYAGGWEVLQSILKGLLPIATKHNVPISTIAARWVLDQPAVGGVILGSHLKSNGHLPYNLKVLGLSLDEDDHVAIRQVLDQSGLQPLPGDSGDEYRRPPYLTASGDLSHHLGKLGPIFPPQQTPWGSTLVKSGTLWEGMAGYSRGIRRGNRICISGTTATHGVWGVVGGDDPEAQAIFVLDKIKASIESLGGQLEDVVRTRIFMPDVSQWEAVCRAHGRVFGDIAPANTLVQARLVGDEYLVEIEAEAELLLPLER